MTQLEISNGSPINLFISPIWLNCIFFSSNSLNITFFTKVSLNGTIKGPKNAIYKADNITSPKTNGNFSLKSIAHSDHLFFYPPNFLVNFCALFNFF